MKISEITEVKDICTCDCGCGKPVCETCGKPHAKKDIKETMTSGGTGASSIAMSISNGNGFASGGIGTEPIKRVSNDKPKSKKKKKTKA